MIQKAAVDFSYNTLTLVNISNSDLIIKPWHYFHWKCTNPALRHPLPDQNDTKKNIYLSYLLDSLEMMGGGVGRWWAVLMYAMTLFSITKPNTSLTHTHTHTKTPVLTASISCYVRNSSHLPAIGKIYYLHREEGMLIMILGSVSHN